MLCECGIGPTEIQLLDGLAGALEATMDFQLILCFAVHLACRCTSGWRLRAG
jgi:hypothetical protein